MSPVEIWGTPNSSFSNLAWVPFPLPGAPIRIRAWATKLDLRVAPPPANTSGARSEALVVAHDQLRLNLVNRVHGHTDHNQQGSAAKIEGHPKPIEQEPWEIVVNPVADQRQV